jgi:hypothetical protein
MGHHPAPCLGDWAQEAGWETFAGALDYSGAFSLPADQTEGLFLDLGDVGQIAEVWMNGRHAGVRAWAPYRLEIGALCQPGDNRVIVRVTNSMANRYDGLQLPSGLIGPVTLRAAHPSSG